MADAQSIVDQAYNSANAYSQTASSFLNNLASAANANFTNLIPNVWGAFVPIGQVEGALNAISGAYPSRPAVSIPGYDAPRIPTITITDIDTSMPLVTAAAAKVSSDLANGGYGIDPNDEAMLLDRTRERELGNAQTAVDEAERSFVNRRFQIPPGALYAAIDKARQDAQSAISRANSDIYVKRADQFVQLRQRSIDNAWAGDRTRIELLVSAAQFQEIRARVLLETLRTQTEIFRAQIQAAVEQAMVTARLYEADASVFSARANVAAETARIAVAEFDANARAFVAIQQVNIENARNLLQSYIANADLREKAADAATGHISTIIAGIMSSVNGVAAVTKQQ